MNEKILKYPRTLHIEGSRIQPGDEDLDSVPLESLAGRHVVVEEKIDGANSGIRFDPGGGILLQSRGHYLAGGARERQFDLFKRWAPSHAHALREVLGTRYVMYGEWTYAKHAIFYDRLPHYFIEYDLYDRESETFLDTPGRRRLLSGLPIVSAPVLYSGLVPTYRELVALVGRSNYVGPSPEQSLEAASREAGVSPEVARAESDTSGTMEGLYIKEEAGGAVVGRYKWVRAAFLQAVLESGSHWMSRPIIRNRLADGVDLFAG
jgi:hypothetical protein